MKTSTCLLLAGLAAASARAGDNDDRERVLQAFFENRLVTVSMDMPATSRGVDVHGDAPEGERVSMGKVYERIAESGVSLREGARVPITKIHVKDDLIEFHLAGGGFNSFWNSSGSVSPTYTGKSRREKDLEREVKEETDSRRKRQLERELNDERRLREQDERRSREIAEERNEIRRERDRRRAESMGSRFNLRFEKRVPASAATPQGVMELLSPWVDFSGLPGAEAYAPRPSPRRGEEEPEDDELRPGMSRAEVQERLGQPREEKSSRDGDLHKSVAIFDDGERRREVTFVNGVLVQFRELGHK
jgi:hypothetical protein